jgi:hypothetical protein
LRRLLSDSALASRAAAVARRQARSLFWENVGARYIDLVHEVVPHCPRLRPSLAFPPPIFEHLLALTDDVGVFEHARLAVPRREHGYCTDDVARALVAVMREPVRVLELELLAETCLGFLAGASRPDGRFRNRLSLEGRWLDEVGSDDATGRALWGAGVASGSARSRAQRERALSLFVAGANFRTRSPRANAFAVLGAVEVLAVAPRGPAAAAYGLLRRAAARMEPLPEDTDWPWPEARLAYANAVLAEARIAAGTALGDDQLVSEGLDLLAWLVDIETGDGCFSFTPVGGWAAREPRPGFDQQPIEAAAMTDACARAFDVTGEQLWRRHALRAAAWFLGANDRGVPLLDREGGGCRDGLTADGVNQNEGAESTICLITSLQLARRLQAAARRASTSSSVRTVAAPTQLSAAPYVR